MNDLFSLEYLEANALKVGTDEEAAISFAWVSREGVPLFVRIPIPPFCETFATWVISIPLKESFRTDTARLEQCELLPFVVGIHDLIQLRGCIHPEFPPNEHDLQVRCYDEWNQRRSFSPRRNCLVEALKKKADPPAWAAALFQRLPSPEGGTPITEIVPLVTRSRRADLENALMPIWDVIPWPGFQGILEHIRTGDEGRPFDPKVEDFYAADQYFLGDRDFRAFTGYPGHPRTRFDHFRGDWYVSSGWANNDVRTTASPETVKALVEEFPPGAEWLED